jgi:hypothetical protein
VCQITLDETDLPVEPVPAPDAGLKASARIAGWRRSHQVSGLRPGQPDAVDPGLLTRADPQGHPVPEVAHGVGLGVAEDDQAEQEILSCRRGQCAAHDVVQQRGGEGHHVTLPAQPQAEDLACLVRRGRERLVRLTTRNRPSFFLPSVRTVPAA